MKSIKYLIGDKRYSVKSALIGYELWLHINGETQIIDLRPKATTSSGAAPSASGAILAPMPGKILKVNFSVGDEVAARKVIIIMEAMKMEYSLSAPFTGSIKEMSCREGQQVELNQKLAVVEPQGDMDEK